jgi:hypothetical protein
VLFEIATNGPGFTLDERPEELGTTLKLPPRYEAMRERLERSLPPLRLPHTKVVEGPHAQAVEGPHAEAVEG